MCLDLVKSGFGLGLLDTFANSIAFRTPVEPEYSWANNSLLLLTVFKRSF